MKRKEEETFFNEIEEVLHSHEDSYEDGAWEEFERYRKPNKRKWPIYGWIAAAMILIVAGISLYNNSKTKNSDSIQAVVKPIEREKTEQVTSSASKAIPSTNQTISSLTEKLISKPNQKINLKEEETTKSPSNETLIAAIDQETAENPAVVKGDIHSEIVKNEPEKVIFEKLPKSQIVSAGAYDSLVNRNHTTPTIDKQNSRITYSLVVSPSMSNQKINFGAGMELSYRIDDRVSLSGGLMYSTLNAKSDGNNSLAYNQNATQGASLAVSGIELPLGIQYTLNSGFYASAGVSALGLLNDRLEYSFLQERTVALTQSSPTGPYEEYRVVSEQKTQKSIEPLNNYMGFFNFSAGKKQTFGNTNLNIGPFVKIPFSSVSSERIKLLQGGVRVSIDF